MKSWSHEPSICRRGTELYYLFCFGLLFCNLVTEFYCVSASLFCPASRYRPVRQMSSRLQANSAPTWLTQSISFEDNETVGVGHQQIKAKVEARPPPTVLQRIKKDSSCVNTDIITAERTYCGGEIVWLTSPSLVSFLPHLMLHSSNSSLFASCGLTAYRRIKLYSP